MFAHLHGIEARQTGEIPLISGAWIAGVSGVDLFFVISGFIMVWVAGETPPSVRNAGTFLFARVMRIYPLWWLFAGAMAVYLLLTYGQPWDAQKIAAVNVGGVEHMVKSFLLIPHDAFPILPLGWTLIHEMYFYVVFALLLLLPQSFRIRAMIIWTLLILAGISAQLTGFYADNLISLILFPMTLEFLMGAGVAWMIKAGWTQWRWPALALGLFGFGWAFYAVNFRDTTALLAIARTFSYGPAFALIVYACVAFEVERGIGRFVPASLVYLGDWSYSLYLCHLLVISALARIFFLMFAQEGYVDNAIFIGLAIMASIGVAGLTYRFFEQPVISASRTARKSWFAPRS